MPPFDWTTLDALTAIRRRYLKAGIRAELENHSFGIDFGAMATNVAVDRRVTIPPEADFIWIGNAVKPHGDQGNAGSVSGVELGAFNLRITVTPPDRQLGTFSDGAGGARGFIPILSIAGRGRCPFIWPAPLVLGGSAVLTFELRNRGATTQTVSLTLLGVRVRRYQGAA